MEDTTLPPSNHLPIDLITSEVLPRLPAKALVKFAAVCKSWYSLIRNPDFVNTHLRLNLSKPMIPCFLCICRCNRFAVINPCDCNLFSNCRWYIASENPHGRPAVHGLRYSLSNMRSIGSCKGLICFRITENGPRRGIFLYNPSLRILKTVEELPRTDHCYGFGYSEQTNDHRLVRVTYKEDYVLSIDYRREMQHVEVYSLTTDSWHEIQEIPPRVLVGRCSSSSFYFGGACHWLTYMWSAYDPHVYMAYADFPSLIASIVSFDFNQEVFRDVTLPGELQVDYGWLIDDLSVFEESLALFVGDKDEIKRYHRSETYHIWVMREDGAWNKRLSLCFREHVPQGLLPDGTVVIEKLEGVSMIFYGFEDGQFKNFGRFRYVKRVDDFVESLLLLGLDNVSYNF